VAVGGRRDLVRDASTDPKEHRVGVDDGAAPPSHNDGSVDANSDAAVPSLLVLLGFSQKKRARARAPLRERARSEGE
jgi:hypothetical protein